MCLQQDKFAFFKNLQIVKLRHTYTEKFEKFPIKKAKNALTFIYSLQTICFMHKAIRIYKRHQTQTHRTRTEI